MKLIILILIFCVSAVLSSCPTTKKVSCAAAMVGCGTTCVCDFPACECCPLCLACVTATAADCCECLFPGWSGCTDKKLIQGTVQNSKFFPNQTTTKNPCMCYLGQGKYSCGSVFNGQVCCNNKWCPCNPNVSQCDCTWSSC